MRLRGHHPMYCSSRRFTLEKSIATASLASHIEDDCLVLMVLGCVRC